MKDIKSHDQLRMFILDVLRHDDIEPLSSILNLLNNRGCVGWREFWPHDFTRSEVLSALGELATDGMIRVIQEVPNQEDLVQVSWSFLDMANDAGTTWFSLAPAGREAWREWEPPVPPQEDVGQ